MPDRFEIYSFNLDDLDDSGASLLGEVGLECNIMKLPGGKQNKTFLTYVSKSPQTLFINEYSRTILEPKSLKPELNKDTDKKNKTNSFTFPEKVPSNIRYQMQLQSLFNGDFLLQSDKGWSLEIQSPHFKVMSEVKSYLPSAPFRYRLSPTTAFKNYSKIESLCSDFIKRNKESNDLSWVRSFKVISLMGIWNHTNNPEYLIKAISESRTLLKNDYSAQAGLVARYCLARYALRERRLSKKSIIDNFVAKNGGNQPNDMAIAAASILSLIANAVDLHEHHRDLFLKTESEEPYSVLSFLRNPHHRHYLFKGDSSFHWWNREFRRSERRFVINNDVSIPRQPFPISEFIKLNGDKVSFPDKYNESVTIMMLLEPPSNGNLILNPSIYKIPEKTIVEVVNENKKQNKKKKNKKSRPRPTPEPSGTIHRFSQLAEDHVNKGVQLVLAFLGDDLEQIKGLQKKYSFPCEVVMAPSGLHNPIVRSLDLFSADRFPNTFLIRRDGTIAWHATGFPYRMEPTLLEYQSYLALRNHIYRCDLEDGLSALKLKDFKKAKQRFSGPYLSEINLKHLNSWRQNNGRTEYHKWTSSQYYGKALALIGLGEWEEALKYIEKSGFEHTVYFRHDEKRPCLAEIEMNRVHSLILEKLGRMNESKIFRSKTTITPTYYPTKFSDFNGYDKPYEIFNKKLSQLKLNQP
jgi:hypothetical protein